VPQRVLLFTTDLEVGGTPHVVRDLAVRLRGSHRTTTVACIAPWGPVAGEIEAAGVRVHPLNATSGVLLPRVMKDLCRLGRSFDVIMSFLVHANFVAAATMPLLPGVRLIQSVQTTQPRPRWHWMLQGLIAPAAETILVPSTSAARNAVYRSEVPPSHITVIPNAIDFDQYAVAHRPAPDGRFRVGFLGRLDPVKRLGDLVQAMELVPDAVLHAYGEGEMRRPIESLIERLRLQNRVTLHGVTHAVAAALANMDVLVLPSDAEGFGLVLIEAMAAGVPVIGTDADGIRDIVQHEKTGLLVPRRSPTMIAGAIERLRADATLRQRLCDNARRFVHDRFSWPAVLEQYERLLTA